MIRYRETAFVALGYLMLAGCGGGSGAGVAVAPIPGPPPTPPFLPLPPPPSPPKPVEVSTSTEFTSVGSDIKIRFDASSQKYEILFPGQSWLALTPASRSEYAVINANGTKIAGAYFPSGTTYTYTGFAETFDHPSAGVFAYGIATPASAMPVTGSASYTAELSGRGDFYSLGGTAKLDFDFAKGALSGSMKVEGNDPAGWGPYDLGQYDFVRTVYSTGSPSFAGALSSTARSGLGGSFSGTFTGPTAQELMGRWELQFRDVYEPGRTIDGSGVMVGKR